MSNKLYRWQKWRKLKIEKWREKREIPSRNLWERGPILSQYELFFYPGDNSYPSVSFILFIFILLLRGNLDWVTYFMFERKIILIVLFILLYVILLHVVPRVSWFQSTYPPTKNILLWSHLETGRFAYISHLGARPCPSECITARDNCTWYIQGRGLCIPRNSSLPSLSKYGSFFLSHKISFEWRQCWYWRAWDWP